MRGLQATTVVLLMCLGTMASGVGTNDHGPQCPLPDGNPDIQIQAPISRDLLSNVDGHFTENLGQLGEGAGSFYCLGEPLSVSLGPGWIDYFHRPGQGGKGVLVRVQFLDANSVGPVGSAPLSHPTNFLKGDDPDRFVIGARSFREVRYPGLWEGIDLVYRFDQGMLKYDLVVAPFADLEEVRFRYSGQDRLLIDEVTGDLVIRTPVIDLVDQAPISLQSQSLTADGITSRYVLSDERTVSFQVEGHDPSLPLVIDPGLNFSTYIGGDKEEFAGMVVDHAGDVYLIGTTNSSDFPTTPGVVNESDMLDGDVFVLKLKGDGSELLFSSYIGSSEYESGWSIYIYPNMDILLAGGTGGTDFPTTPGAYQIELNEPYRPGSEEDAFVMRLDGNCSRIIWSTLLGGVVDDVAFHAEPLSNGDIMVFGSTGGGFPTVSGCLREDHIGLFDLFAARMDANGTTLLRSTYIGGEKYDSYNANTVVVEEDEAVYIAISTESKMVRVTQDAFQSKKAGEWDALVMKIDLNLTKLHYSTYLGGKGDDYPLSLDVDEEGCAYVTGFTRSLEFPTTLGAMNRDYGGGMDAFLTKIGPDGTYLEFSTYIGTSMKEWGSSIKLSDDGLVYLAITTDSDDLPTTEHAFKGYGLGFDDIYLAVFDSECHSVRYGSYIGGFDFDEAAKISLGPDSSVTIAARSYSTNYPTTEGAYDRNWSGYDDIVVTRLDVVLSDPLAPWPPTALQGWLDGDVIELEWELPVDPGEYNISDLRIYRGISPDALELLYQIPPIYTNWTDLPHDMGTTYHYVITAYSPAGQSVDSNVVNVTYTAPPSAPRDLVAMPGCETVQLNWSAPNFTGGLPPVEYTLLRGSSIDELDELVTLGPVEGYRDDDVVNGQVYYYQLRAKNRIMVGNWSIVVSARPTGPPTTPLNVRATASDESVTLEWEPPDNDGGENISMYIILWGLTSEALIHERTVTGDKTRWVHGPLENGVTRFYTMMAETELGRSLPSIIVKATPMGLPGMPWNISASAEDGRVRLSWEPPMDDGGAPIEGFVIHRGLTSKNLVLYAHLGGDETFYEDPDVVSGLTLYYAVYAWTLAGDGPMSIVVEATLLVLPGPPKDLLLETGNGMVTLWWYHPADVDSRDVIQYVVYKGDSADTLTIMQTVDGSILNHQDIDVVPGNTYHYAVSAVTRAGEGAPTAPKAVTPYGPPSAPVELVATPGDREVRLSWSPPEDDGASAIVGYLVLRGTYPDLLVDLETVPAITSYVDSLVNNGVTYYYAVVAINGAGPGDRSVFVEATPMTVPDTRVPGRVSDLEGEARPGTVVLQWSPRDPDDVPVTGYVVLKGASPTSMEVVATLGSVTSWTDLDVEPGKTYHYSVYALNVAVAGEPSDVVKVKVPEEVSVASGLSSMYILAIVIVLVLIVITAFIILRRDLV